LIQKIFLLKFVQKFSYLFSGEMCSAGFSHLNFMRSAKLARDKLTAYDKKFSPKGKDKKAKGNALENDTNRMMISPERAK